MFLDLFFPNRCLNCNRIISADELICEACFDHIPFAHHDFHSDNLLLQKCRMLFPTENAWALMNFEEEGLSRKIIHELKYKHREIVGKHLASWTTDRLNFGETKPDLMVSVPLHPKKLKKRGYNQLHLFAETLSNHYQIPHNPSLIKRNFYKKAQALKDKARRSETENLFSITETISGKHILLIDDVFTTGNTMSAFAWEILKYGNNKVSVLVMAMD